LNDRVKLLAYRIFDPVKAVVKTGTEVDPHPAAKAEPKPQGNADVEAKPAIDPKPESQTRMTSNLTPQIAARAYELYESQGRHDGQSAQNWDQAEQEIRATQAKTEPKPAASGA